MNNLKTPKQDTQKTSKVGGQMMKVLTDLSQLRQVGAAQSTTRPGSSGSYKR